MAKAASKTKAPAGKVVEATMNAGGASAIGGMMDPRAIEKAMGDAVTKAYKDGVTDDAEILKLKMAARHQVKSDFRASEEKRLAKLQAEATKKGG